MRLFCAALILVLAVGVRVATAAPLQKLPTLTLVSSTGEAVTDVQLPVPGKWLLIYLSGETKGDRNLLNMLQGLQELATGEKVTLVVAGAKQGELDNLIKKNEKLLMFRWLGDADRSAAKALQLAGSATVMGMNGPAIGWTVAGTGKDKKVLRSQLVDWVK
ncbi:MAG: hypothetical protein PHY09_11550 [Desulfuromonadaceae bacterium]|nr:hypothetical protein [Desulfuromonadaceae bacterium]MDD5106336.1 hypothetical protein [Desulfuromonadaceae bacterium]